MDCSLLSSSVHRILQARILEWVATSFPNLSLSLSLFIYIYAAKLLQSGPTLCDPVDGSPPGSPVPGILQARTREWVAISFSNAWKWKVKVKTLSHVRLSATPWTAAYQAPPSMGYSRQECWSGVPLPSPRHWIMIHQKITIFNNWQMVRGNYAGEDWVESDGRKWKILNPPFLWWILISNCIKLKKKTSQK